MTILNSLKIQNLPRLITNIFERTISILFSWFQYYLKMQLIYFNNQKLTSLERIRS